MTNRSKKNSDKASPKCGDRLATISLIVNAVGVAATVIMLVIVNWQLSSNVTQNQIAVVQAINNQWLDLDKEFVNEPTLRKHASEGAVKVLNFFF
ncbi:MAG: hypothetical protein EXR11_09885 [Rhodospirillaceae bacterium]|nr:hypothetical protein [Rhodospirillaceae bacterium]